MIKGIYDKNTSMKAKNIFTKTLVIILLTGISTTIFLGFKKGDDFNIAKSMDIFYSLFRDVNVYYVDETNPEKMVETGINAMLEELDPYTVYIPEKDMDAFNFMTTGEYGGIGALIRSTEEFPIVARPYKGFPADKAGLKAGDKILEIDGNPANEIPLDEVSERLKGVPQTSVKLLIERPYTGEKMEKELVREEVKIKSVPYYGVVQEDIGYIRMSKFTPDVSREIKNALRDLKAEHQIKSVILDLRGNPGGLLVEAPRVCNLFISKGEEIVSTKGKTKKWNQTLKTSDAAYDTEIPLAVLVSRTSASASEIVAGAIQDLDRGVVIGQRTFGKGLVQTTIPLNYNAQLKVTTAKYYIPSGRCIQALDYSNRNEDGSVGHVPDSLISKYSTRNGRTVFDGGGIRPDVEVKSDALSKITISLITKNILFDYATKYVAEHPSIAPVEQFELSEADFQDFKNFLKGKDFDYETLTENKFEDLVETAKREKYYGLSKEAFESLEKKLAHDKYKDIQTFRDEIEQLLEEEIVARYYYQAGRIQTA